MRIDLSHALRQFFGDVLKSDLHIIVIWSDKAHAYSADGLQTTIFSSICHWGMPLLWGLSVLGSD